MTGRRLRHMLLALLTVTALAAALPVTSGAAGPDPNPPHAVTHRPSCPPGQPAGRARCHAHVRTDLPAQPKAVSAPAGYGPADLRAAYNAPFANAGQLVAIVDAYDDPTAEDDLGVYRSKFGLPPCTSANGCFRKVDQRGGTLYPFPDAGWAQEISLDLDVVSAMCPNCRILLVEADSNYFDDLGAAVNTAVQLGARVVSNSYGGGEWSGETSYESAYFNHPGIAITASSGDDGYGVEFPAASRYVTAVGGTSLNRTANARGWSETAWNGAGSGCSRFIVKPSWQHDADCTRRTVADVSAVADPATGVAVYDSFPYFGQSGWLVFGGTSVAAPLIGSIYALAGNSSVNYGSLPYGNPSGLYDVASGSNGQCGGSYLCTAKVGYDGPTGLGTPNATAAFTPALSVDYALAAAPSSASVVAGASASFTVTLSTTSGYNSSVSLAVAGLPSGASASFNPIAVTPTSGGASSTLTVATGSATPAGTYTLTITGTGDDPAKTQHSTSVNLTVSVPDYTLTVSPASRSIAPGANTTYTATLTASNGYNSGVSLAVSGLPTGASASFNPTSVTPTSGGTTSTLTVTTGSGTPAGTYSLTIAGTGGDTAQTKHSTTVSLTVAVPDFSLAASPSSRSVTAGGSASYTATLTASGGYNSAVNLAVSGLPSGASASFKPTSVTPTATGASSTLTVTTGAATPAGTYTLTITGTGGDAAATKHSALVTLVVSVPAVGDFGISAAPSSQTLFPGSTTTFTVTLSTSNGYSSPVNLSVSGLPPGVTASFSPASVTPTSAGGNSTLTLSSTVFVSFATSTLTITGAGTDAAHTTHSTTVSLTVF